MNEFPANLKAEFDNFGAKIIALFTSGLPAQMGDKVENVVTGFSEVLRIYGDLNRRIGEAYANGDILAFTKATDEAEAFVTDTARFFAKSGTDVNKFRHNSYIWAKRHCSPEAAAIMGTTDGTPEDYI